MLWCPTDNVSININTLISAKSKHMTTQIFQNNWWKEKEIFIISFEMALYLLCNFYFYGLGKRIKCMVRSQIWHFRAKKYFHFITSCLFPVHFTWVSLRKAIKALFEKKVLASIDIKHLKRIEGLFNV